MIERVELFDKRLLLYFLLSALFIFALTSLYTYHNYTKMSEFDTYVSDANVLSQSLRHKHSKSYYILKLRLDNGAIAYVKESTAIRDLVGRRVYVTLFMHELDFLSYIRGTFYRAYISKVYPQLSMQKRMASIITSLHVNHEIGELYSALYTASALSKPVREKISRLGISHLVAISGYHLSLIGMFLFFLLKWPYTYLQKSYFPYRNRNRDIFIISASVLFLYAYFLNFTPSVIRSFAMLIIGYVLYDRGIKIISMQTLFLTMVILLSLFPLLLFSLGFWLSLSGVFYIVLFLKHFDSLQVSVKFVLLHFWVYLAMLPLSLYIFETFSLYHPLSILWTMLFNLFYPLSLLAHILGFATLFDPILETLLGIDVAKLHYTLSKEFMGVYIVMSLLAIRYKWAFYGLIMMIILLFFIQ